jgi:hypothetical protein
MYDFVYLSVRRSVRDSHWSRDYHDGTGIRVSYENPGFYRTRRRDEGIEGGVTPDFPKKTKCIWYVRQDQVYTHKIDVMSEISLNGNKNVQELNHYIISLLHSDVRLEGIYNDQTITMKT